ncbi:uncharacterized protein METZ01_LOCUS340954, partial [marine metagenome]
MAYKNIVHDFVLAVYLFTLGHSVEDDPGGSTATFGMLTCSCTQEMPLGKALLLRTLAFTIGVYTSTMNILV